MTETADPEKRQSLTAAEGADDSNNPETTAPDATWKLFNAVVLALTVAAFYLAQEILLPIALAIFLSFLLSPVVSRLEKELRLGRIAAVVITCALATALIGGVAWTVIKQFDGLMTDLPKYEENLRRRVHALRGTGKSSLEKATETIEDITQEIEREEGGSEKKNKKYDQVEGKKGSKTVDGKKKSNSKDKAAKTTPASESVFPPKAKKLTSEPIEPPKAPENLDAGEKQTDNGAATKEGMENPVEVKVVAMPESPLTKLKNQLGPFVAPLTTSGLVLVLLVFILVQREDVRNRLIHLVGTAHVRATTEAMSDAGKRLSRYLRMQLLINVFCGIVVGGGLAIIGLPNALMWGVLTFLLRYLPYVGPWVAATLPIAVSLAYFPGWTQPLLTIGLFIGMELIANNVLEPWLYGSSIGVSSLGIIINAIFWTWLWGPVGLVLAMPLTVCLIVAGSYVPQLRFVAVLFGDGSMLPLEHRIYQRLLAMDEDEAGQLANEFLKTDTIERLYHLALLPALHLAERDRHAGRLSSDQEKFVIRSVRDLVEELDDSTDSDDKRPADANGAGRRRVLCIPARDEADEAAAPMLANLLRRHGAVVQQGTTHVSAGEWVERLRAEPVDAVVISALPPLGGQDGRYLCKRLRREYPDLPIIVGAWTAKLPTNAVQRLNDVGASDVVVSLDEAVDAVRRAPIAKRAHSRGA